jgi:hypothetical protein
VLWRVTNIERPARPTRLRLHARKAQDGLFTLGDPGNFTLWEADGAVVAVYDAFYEFLQAMGLDQGDSFDVWLEWK